MPASSKQTVNVVANGDKLGYDVYMNSDVSVNAVANKFDLDDVRSRLLDGKSVEVIAAETGIPRSTILYNLRQIHKLTPRSKTIWELVPYGGAEHTEQ